MKKNLISYFIKMVLFHELLLFYIKFKCLKIQKRTRQIRILKHKKREILKKPIAYLKFLNFDVNL